MTVTWAAFVGLSVLGAAIFFVAGLVLTRDRTAATAGAAAESAALPELMRLRAEHAQALADQRRLGDEVVRLAAAARATVSVPAPPPPPPPPAPPARAPADAELDVLRRRLADTDELRAENARLRRTSEDAPRLAARITQLEHELGEATRRSVSATLSIGPAPAASALAATMSSGGLDELVRQLAADPRFSAAIVSDELGLLVAGTGEQAEELAALGGYLAGVGERARQLAGLGPAVRVVIEDDRNTTLAAVHLPGGALIAVTVSRPQRRATIPAKPAPARA